VEAGVGSATMRMSQPAQDLRSQQRRPRRPWHMQVVPGDLGLSKCVGAGRPTDWTLVPFPWSLQ
jgi:hypothetical protein